MAKKRKTPPAEPPVPDGINNQPLNDDERRFTEEWLVDRNNTLAYRRMRPGCDRRNARQAGYEMRHRPHVAAEIEAGLRAQRVNSQVRADKLVEELARLAFSDILELYDEETDQLRRPRHVPYNVRKCIASMKVTRQRVSRTRNRKTVTTVTDSVIEYKLWNKGDAIGRLMKHLGMETEVAPIDALLALLPRDMADAIRHHLAGTVTLTNTVPSANGSH